MHKKDLQAKLSIIQTIRLEEFEKIVRQNPTCNFTSFWFESKHGLTIEFTQLLDEFESQNVLGIAKISNKSDSYHESLNNKHLLILKGNFSNAKLIEQCSIGINFDIFITKPTFILVCCDGDFEPSNLEKNQKSISSRFEEQLRKYKDKQCDKDFILHETLVIMKGAENNVKNELKKLSKESRRLLSNILQNYLN